MVSGAEDLCEKREGRLIADHRAAEDNTDPPEHNSSDGLSKKLMVIAM
jgi:hypothetical protein